MPGRVFFDTNVLLYTMDPHAVPEKRLRALALRDQHFGGEGTAVISTQVLQEFFVIATNKFKLPAQLVRDSVNDYSQFNVVQVTPALILEAIDLHRLHQIAFWDALILRAARAGSCSELYTEDLNTGQTFDGVRVLNPFV